MKVSLSWLQEFVDVPVEPRLLKADLTSIGLNVESFAPAANDVVLDVEVTTNRPDCLSHYGVAREIAAFYRKPLKSPKISLAESSAAASGEISIEIKDPDLCARYCGRVIRNLKVRPSPEWLAERLRAVGQRPINNVADITNYVLMELGQPLHAFDLARIREHRIIVRRARPGEPMRTLDGADLKLAAQDLVIADAQRPVALAGVMGGEDSQISAGTESVLLESAWFDPPAIRRTSKSQELHTEASHRFERGADIDMAPRAVDRAAAMIAEIAGGEVLKGQVDIYPRPRVAEEIKLRAAKIFSLLGAEIPHDEVERILRSLEFSAAPEGGDAWLVKAPSFRIDVTREVDLVEEVARHYGYDKLPARVRAAPPRIERDAVREKHLEVSQVLVGLGYREIIPPDMVDPQENARFTDLPPVPLANPLSQEASAMRSSALPSMVRALRWNIDRDQTDLRFFELGRIYINRQRELPEEKRILTLGLCGHRRPASVHDTEKALEFFDVKGDLERLLDAFDLPQVSFKAGGPEHFEKNLCGQLSAGGKGLATFGQLSAAIAQGYKLRLPVWLAEIDFDALLEFPLRQPGFHAFSKFPAVERDFSLIVPESVTYAALASAVRKLAIEEIAGFAPIERKIASQLPPDAVPAGHASLLLRVTFQSAARTLASREIDEASGRILKSFEALGVRLRT